MPTAFASGRAASATAPSDRFVPIAPDDAADLPGGLTRSLFVGGAGDLRLRDVHGNEAIIASQAGQYHPLRVARVLAAGTTATGLVALY